MAQDFPQPKYGHEFDDDDVRYERVLMTVCCDDALTSLELNQGMVGSEDDYPAELFAAAVILDGRSEVVLVKVR